LAAWLGGTHHGPAKEWSSVRSNRHAGPGDLSFLVSSEVPGDASVLLCSTPLDGRTCITVNDPKYSLILVLNELFHVEQFPPSQIDPSAVVHPGAVIMEGCCVGAGTVLYPNSVLYPRTVIGSECIIHAGAVIGADGFGFHPGPKGPEKVPHVGGVAIGDRVEIGANTTIDRGFIEATTIGRDCKIDNLVHIGHNCVLGNGVLIAAQTGLSGSVIVGDGVQIGGQVGIVEHVQVGKGAQIGAQSGVLRDVHPGQRVLGTPAQDAMKTLRMYATERTRAETDSTS
jgi:UDP-3-O-[3-hydroxymyristoyl] glucosamine N-acyltransferase LpxD